jgi:hypothetical protein
LKTAQKLSDTLRKASKILFLTGFTGYFAV